MIVTVVNLCALGSGGQHLSWFLYECWTVIIFFVYIAVGRVLLQRFRKRVLFLLAP